MDFHPYTVLKELVVAHWPFEQPSHNSETGDPIVDDGGNPVMVPDNHPSARYAPGQTVHLDDKRAREFLASGHIAPPGSVIEIRHKLIARPSAPSQDGQPDSTG